MNTGTKKAAAITALALVGVTLALAPAQAPAQASSTQALPPGLHARTVWYQVDDCGPRNKGKAKFIIWRGRNGSSAVFCPNGTIWTS